MPTPEVFYLHLCGEQRGPYTIPQIDHLLNSKLIPEETLYWREGLEQWQPVTELVPLRRPPNRLKRVILGLVIAAPLLLLALLFGPPLIEGWREATANDFTFEDAYWKARDVVRQHHAGNGSLVAFSDYDSAAVELLKTHEARLVLQGQITALGGTAKTMTWHVQLRYDPAKSEWSALEVQARPRLP